ncbi:hypothetical protein BXZ70DRAFT_909917 [Cristinia sonorae]|uniref:Fungal-type protein kinase domain-containing protein n=1 Tax=Cristinia sonorae TaxID=1940300 RepID=A0A8K0UI35_9AGAR|nr:hypothetical protein BXZ70DRAFT_909917 [Cristinia sonorae]
MSRDSRPRRTGLNPVLQHMDMHANTMEDDLLQANLAREPSTPPRRAASHVANDPAPIELSLDSSERNKGGTSKDDALVKYLEAILTDKTVSDYPVADFLYSVYGLGKEDFHVNTDPPEGGFSLCLQALKKYNNGSYAKGTGGERSAYQPLLQIFEHLSDQLKGRVGNCKKPNGSRFVNMLDHTVEGEFVDFKPDIMTSWIKAASEQHWDRSAVSAELKKKKKYKKKKMVIKIELDQLPGLVRCVIPKSDSSSVQSSRPPTPFAAGSSPHQPPSPSNSDNSDGLEIVSQHPTNSSTFNRSNPGTTGEHSADSQQAIPQSSAKPHHGLTHNDMQAVKYVHELACHGIRSYATGLLIEDFKMTLFYMDHMGLVKSTPFDFVDESYFLLLYLAAVTYAAPKDLGFLSLLQFPKSPVPASTFPNYANVLLILPDALGSNGQSIGEVTFIIDSDRRIIQSYGAIGRATVVVPVQPDPSNVITLDLSGRDAHECLMAKISWQSKRRTGEDTHIRAVRMKLSSKQETRHLLEHIVDMKCSITQTMEELGLPRAFMGLSMDDASERVCRILIMREYIPLNLVESADEFKAAFVGAVKGHHAAHDLCDVLHRDISTNNIMFYREPSNKVIGVLCDWDLAKQVNSRFLDINGIADDLHNSKISKAASPAINVLKAEQPIRQYSRHPATVLDDTKPETRFRTGTGPFIALDQLLYTHVPQHLYRHDLESFFWVLVWFVVTFRPAEKKLGRIDEWLKGDLRETGLTKAQFLRVDDDFDVLTDRADASYKPIVEEWIVPLRLTLFGPICDAYHGYDAVARMAQRWRYRKPTAEEEEVYRSKLRELVKEREGIATYETFMNCIIPKEEVQVYN